MSQKQMLITAIVFLALLGIVSFVSLRAQNSDNRPNISIRQLAPVNGIAPVEILEHKVSIKSASVVENAVFSVRNNTQQSIRAVCVAFSIVLSNGKDESKDTFYHVVETYAHPDLRRGQNALKAIGPGESTEVVDAATTTYDSSLKVVGLEVNVDYVEFEDQTVIGPDKKGSRLVAEIRDGARKYKYWLVKQFTTRADMAADSIASHLDESELPVNLGITGPHRILGAKMYRNRLRFIRANAGSSGLAEYLHLVLSGSVGSE